MNHIQLINLVIASERRLELKQEMHQNSHPATFVNYLAAPQPFRKEQKSIFARILQRRKANQADYRRITHEPCQTT